MCVRKSLNSLTQAQATRNIKTGVNTRLRILKFITRTRFPNTLTKMTKMQASEIEQLDNKSFNRWCEVSLPKVYSFFALICLRDISANAAREIMFLIRVAQ